MNLNELNQKLIAAARRDAPSDRVPYAFEKRIMARLASRPALDTLALWSQSLFRAATACAAIVLLIGVGSLYIPADTADIGSGNTELSQDLQDTLLASVDMNDLNDLNDQADQIDQLEEM